MIENKVAFKEILIYYYGFTIYFANLLFPIFLFLSIIWFTSKLANNSEIIAILSSGISFTRFLRPYIVGAALVSLVTLLMGFFVLPDASEKFWSFKYEYLKKNGEERKTSDIFRQVKPNEYMYVSTYNGSSKTGFDFIYEKFNGNKLEYKLYASRVKYNEKTKDYTLFDYVKRTIGKENDSIEKQEKFIRKFDFEPDDLTPEIYVAETMNIFNLIEFIDRERSKGSSNLDVYLVVLYRKFSIPVSAFILTIIAVSVSAMKRRGGMGINLAIGILVAFSFVFFDKIFGTLAESSSIPPFLAVWFPNFIFGILAIYLLRNARR